MREISISTSFLTKNNFLEKFSRNVKSSCTCTKISYRSCCKLFNVLSVQWYIKFYDVFFIFFCCFAAENNWTRPFAQHLQHFYEQGVLELDLLATWTRFKMVLRRIFSRSFLFQIFPHLLKKPKDKWVDCTFTKPKLRKILHGICFVIEILEKMQQIFNHNRKQIAWLMEMPLTDVDWSDVQS